jgi:hypothetical protein
MDNITKSRIEQKIRDGYQVSIGGIFEKAGEIFKGIALYAIIATLIYFIAHYTISAIIGLVVPVKFDEEEIQTIASSGDTEAIMQMYKEMLSSTSSIISIILSSIVSTALYPIIFSVFTMAKNYDVNKKNAEFSDLFIHYKDGKFLNLFLVSLIVNFIGIIGVYLCILPGIIVYSMWMLAVPLVIFAGADIKEALTYSMQLAFKSFGTFVGLFFIGIAIVIVGLILCCVGFFAAFPFIYVMTYVLYKEIIGFDEEKSEIDQLGTDIYKDNPYMK